MALTRITSDGITDGSIVNADINASAAIAGSKIDPDFGSQTLTTTGKLLITQNTTSIPEIELNGQGPNFIRFTDSQVATGSLDLIFRDSPNTLGIEKSSDGTSLFTVDCDAGLVVPIPTRLLEASTCKVLVSMVGEEAARLKGKVACPSSASIVNKAVASLALSKPRVLGVVLYTKFIESESTFPDASLANVIKFGPEP